MKFTIAIFLLLISGWNFSYGQGAACPNPKLKEAELAAYQTLVKARANAANILSGEITGIEDAKKKSQSKASLDYSTALNGCKTNDPLCPGKKRIDYNDAVLIIELFAKSELVKAQDKEKAANEAAQKNYDEAVRKAMELYHPLCFEASGQDGPTVYTGTVCDTKLDFEITGTIAAGPIVYPFKFKPITDTTGKFSFSTTYGPAVLKGDGTYTIKGVKTGTPRIEMQTSSSGTLMGRTTTGSGPAKISLKCKGE